LEWCDFAFPAISKEGPGSPVASLMRGIERVKKGEPVLIDVVTQPRG
jgi:hypothetical protein